MKEVTEEEFFENQRKWDDVRTYRGTTLWFKNKIIIAMNITVDSCAKIYTKYYL